MNTVNVFADFTIQTLTMVIRIIAVAPIVVLLAGIAYWVTKAS